MVKLGTFFKTLGTKIATLWKTTTWFKVASIGGAIVIATSAVVIPNAVISETGGIFHKCYFSIESIDTEYSYSVANCTEKAKYYYSCACGERGTDLFEYGDALGHDLTHHGGKQVTCTDIGYDEYDTCSRCDYTTYNEISATGHTDGQWITDKEANCTEDGSKHQICSVCSDTINTAVIPATGHTDGEWITDVNATCTEDGSKHQICSVCNDTIKTEVLLKFGHNQTNFVSVEEISNNFYATWSCDRCKKDYTAEYQTISATFSTNLSYGTYPQYGFRVYATGGIGSYEYQYVIYNRYSGSVLGALKTENNGITYTDYYGNDLWANNLVVRVYIIDDVGEIAFDVPLNDGSFGSKSYSIFYSYRLNGGTFSGVDVTIG